MAKIISKIVSTLRGQILNRKASSRRDLQVPITISFLPEANTGRLTMKRHVFSIKGQTKDLSGTGIAFLVDSIRLQEYYLVGENRVLTAELDLPNGKVMMQVIGQRYEQVGEHLSVNKYLIGANIINMNPPEREIYQEFLKYGNKVKNNKNSILELEATKS
jgi:hypothetical protein